MGLFESRESFFFQLKKSSPYSIDIKHPIAGFVDFMRESRSDVQLGHSGQAFPAGVIDFHRHGSTLGFGRQSKGLGSSVSCLFESVERRENSKM